MYLYTILNFPLHTKTGRIEHKQFVQTLLKDGFIKLHKNLYVRHCTVLSNALMHKKRLQQQLFEKCNVSIIFTLDKQNEYSYHYFGRKSRSKNQPQLPQPTPFVEFFLIYQYNETC